MTSAPAPIQSAPAARIGWGTRSYPAPDPRKAVPGVADGKGRGLFAAQGFAPGEVIEESSTVPLDPAQCLALDAMLPLGDYYFAHPEDSDRGLVVLGLTSLANHSETPNARIDWRHEPGLGWICVAIAVQAIPAGEEVTHRYRCPPWFEVKS